MRNGSIELSWMLFYLGSLYPMARFSTCPETMRSQTVWCKAGSKLRMRVMCNGLGVRCQRLTSMRVSIVTVIPHALINIIHKIDNRWIYFPCFLSPVRLQFYVSLEAGGDIFEWPFHSNVLKLEIPLLFWTGTFKYDFYGSQLSKNRDKIPKLSFSGRCSF